LHPLFWPSPSYHLDATEMDSFTIANMAEARKVNNKNNFRELESYVSDKEDLLR